MDKRTAEYLSERIEITDRYAVVTSLHRYGRSYEINVVDTRTGTPFVVRSIEEWQERLRAADLAWSEFLRQYTQKRLQAAELIE